ncbi:preprotein translocase subunit Sec61beta [Candidatus Micrarchaeota archaeon]|nr:preprotein translocase subunit Sec61beta [Candidatus Micrarchaeota archaeon]
MPMASAGMIGFSPDVRIEGKEIEPKILIAATALLVVIVLVATHLVTY